MPAAFVPGSFDPFHNGHLAVVRVAAACFERVTVAVGHNLNKPSGLFTIAERIRMIEDSVAGLANVRVSSFDGLVTTAAREHGADVLVKGIRTATDLDSETVQANTNFQTAGATTLFVPGIGSAALVASRYLREIGIRGGDISSLVPPPVWTSMQLKAAQTVTGAPRQ